MPIFTKDNKKILFIHVPKTGGTSIEGFFKQNKWKMDFFDGGGLDSWNRFMKCSPQHMHNEMLSNIFRLASFDLIIMIVRNPLDRILSDFKWRKKNGLIDSNIEYEDWVIDTLEKYNKNNFIYDNHIRPQIEFEVQNTKIFRLEDTFDGVAEYIEAKVETKFLNKTMPRNMTSKSDTHNKKSFHLSSSTKKILLDFYSRDLKKYNYHI